MRFGFIILGYETVLGTRKLSLVSRDYISGVWQVLLIRQRGSVLKR
jgi:hypothetical protein